MDPSAMDFVMHNSENERPNMPGIPASQNMSQSPCPAMRAAAASEQFQYGGPHSPPRPSRHSHYDPVHSNGLVGVGASWWTPQPQHSQHPQHSPWQYPPPFGSISHRPMTYGHSPSFGALPPISRPIGMDSTPPLYPSASVGADSFSTHAQAAYSPPGLHHHHHRSNMPSLPRPGENSTPSHHGQNGFGSAFQDSLSASGSVLPALNPLASSSRPPSYHTHPNRHSLDTTPTRRGSSGRASRRMDWDDAPSPGDAADARDYYYTSMSYGGGGSAHSPGSPAIPARSPQPSDYEAQVLFASSPEGVSDDDLDYIRRPLGYWEPGTLAAGASASAYDGNGLLVYQTADGRMLRREQVLRGSVPGKRIASKTALSSLMSVKIADLPENERSCIICYNDFGVESPEGVNEEPLRLPKCKHVFGDHCIKKWFEESDSCPYCRDKLPSEPQFRRHHALANFAQHRALMPQHVRAEVIARGLSGTSNAEPRNTTLMEFYESPIYLAPRFQGREADGRRRRPRHSSLRGSPPAAFYMGSSSRHNTSGHRSSVGSSSSIQASRPSGPSIEVTSSTQFAGQLPEGTHSANRNSGSRVASWHESRGEPSSASASRDERMANSDL